MRLKKKIVLLCGIIGVLLVGFGTVAAAPEATSSSEKSYSRGILPRLAEGVKRFELSNGLRVLIFQKRQAPVFAGQIWVKVGSIDEETGASGVAHILEHMAFKGSKVIGTKDYEKEVVLLQRVEELMDRLEQTPEDKELRRELSEVNAQLEELVVDDEFSRVYQKKGAVNLNAGTGADYTFYMVSLPNTAFEFWCWMESDRLLNPVFRQFYKERAVVQEERRMRKEDDPEGRMYEALLSTAYWAHPARVPTVGWASDIAQARRADIEHLYRTYYRPDNMVVALIGDLDPEVVKPLMEKYFSRLPKVEKPLPRIRTVEPKQEGERKVQVLYDAEPQIMLGYHKPVYPNVDDMKFAMMHAVLSDGRSSILYRELVQEKQLALYVYTMEAPTELYPSLFMVGAAPRQGVSNERLTAEIQAIFERIKREGVRPEELEAAKKRAKVGLVNLLGSDYGLAKMLARVELLWGDWEKLFEMYDASFTTTNEDLKYLAEKYLTKENRTFVFLDRPTKKPLNN